MKGVFNNNGLFCNVQCTMCKERCDVGTGLDRISSSPCTLYIQYVYSMKYSTFLS